MVRKLHLLRGKLYRQLAIGILTNIHRINRYKLAQKLAYQPIPDYTGYTRYTRYLNKPGIPPVVHHGEMRVSETGFRNANLRRHRRPVGDKISCNTSGLLLLQLLHFCIFFFVLLILLLLLFSRG